jgi:hypothetical protein
LICLLGFAPKLEAMCLNLSKNPIGNNAAAMFSTLISNPMLPTHRLVSSLRTQWGFVGRVNPSPSKLHTFELDLGHTLMDDDGARALSDRVCDFTPSLKELRLILNGNQITRRGVEHFIRFRNTSLDSLFVNLNANRVAVRECEWALDGLRNLDHLDFRSEAQRRGGGARDGNRTR